MLRRSRSRPGAVEARPGTKCCSRPTIPKGLLDKYGRELVYVWVDGQLFNLEMINAGFAHEYTYDAPYRYQQQFKDAERAAANSGAGLWASDTCGGDTTTAAGG